MILTIIFVVFTVILALGIIGYLAACAGADRWITMKEWLGY